MTGKDGLSWGSSWICLRHLEQGCREVPGLAGHSSPRSQSFDAGLGREEEKQL